MTDHRVRRIGSLLLFCVLFVLGCGAEQPALDEASRAGRTAESFGAAAEDYFREMDGGGALDRAEVQGRNTWIVWTGGNDRFWDTITVSSFGVFDLLKTVSSHPRLKYSRDDRWKTLGLVNEPCFEKATGPDPNRFGLWLDKRRADCPPDPFENDKKYEGVKIGARGKTPNLPVGSFYGYPTGIVGLRLFPNPDFDAAAAAKWDAKRYYEDKDYYERKELVRPYRVGMSCGFCHVGPNPVKPPDDPENPKWENLSSNVGAQYFWVDRIFSWEHDPSNYMYQLLHTSRPGSLDTSLVSTDYINNPRSMNAVYQLGPRLGIARRWGKETLTGGGLHNRQFNDYVQDGPLTKFFEKPGTVWTPRVLKDGADSVGALGALNRVYLNIGLYSEEWLRHFNPLAGGKAITPIEISVARKNSAYWLATEAQTPAMALFFLKTTGPHRLKDAPGGAAYLSKDQPLLRRGKIAFAERCARCHSSKAPTPAPGLDPEGCAGPGYLACWDRYWAWTKTDEYKQQMRQIVLAEDFLEDNQLSTDVRVPVTLLETNACSPLATNAIGGNIWDNFSSQSYKDLPSVGTITVHDPFTGDASALSDAGRRPGLHAPRVPGQRVVDRPLPAEQQHRDVRAQPIGGGPHAVVPGLDREAAVAREAREGPGARRQGARRHRPDDGPELRARARWLPSRGAAAAGRLVAPLLAVDLRRRGDRDRSHPRGHAGGPLVQPRGAAGWRQRGPARRARGHEAPPPVARAPPGSQEAGPGRERRGSAARVHAPGASTARPQQVQGLRGEPRPLLRHRPFQAGARSQRRRQAGADRVPQDLLDAA